MGVEGNVQPIIVAMESDPFIVLYTIYDYELNYLLKRVTSRSYLKQPDCNLLSCWPNVQL